MPRTKRASRLWYRPAEDYWRSTRFLGVPVRSWPIWFILWVAWPTSQSGL